MLTLLERQRARVIAALGDAALMENSDGSVFDDDLDRVRNLTHAAVRQALTGARSGIPRNEAITEHLAALCSEARDVGLHVEDVIVLIKQSWRALVGAQAASRKEDESALSDVVTRCITEYYRDGR